MYPSSDDEDRRGSSGETKGELDDSMSLGLADMVESQQRRRSKQKSDYSCACHSGKKNQQRGNENDERKESKSTSGWGEGGQHAGGELGRE